jgi:hypothetical protein
MGGCAPSSGKPGFENLIRHRLALPYSAPIRIARNARAEPVVAQ